VNRECGLSLEVGGSDCGCVRGVCGEGAVGEERDCDGEFGREEEGEVKEAGPRD
jgi:hypothetical protein